jgi:cell cycle sensor histidine kinase DivJ
MINLLSNAVKFTPAGGRVVLAVVRDGDMIDLSVSDTGIGIAAADLPKLGDPFFQAKSSYDRTHEGTGLGLSVVRGLVGLHGGKLTIESAPGRHARRRQAADRRGRCDLPAGEDRDLRPGAAPRPGLQRTRPPDRLITNHSPA